MKCTKIEVKVGVTVNLGNFESLRLDYGMEAEIGDGDNIMECYDEARDLVTSRIKSDLKGSNGGKTFIK